MGCASVENLEGAFQVPKIIPQQLQTAKLPCMKVWYPLSSYQQEQDVGLKESVALNTQIMNSHTQDALQRGKHNFVANLHVLDK